MRDGDPECKLQLGDRVRWLFDGNEDESFVGTVSGLKRRFPHTPDLSTDSVEVWFDERVHLVEGMAGFKQQWVPAVHVELLPDDWQDEDRIYLEEERARDVRRDEEPVAIQ